MKDVFKAEGEHSGRLTDLCLDRCQHSLLIVGGLIAGLLADLGFPAVLGRCDSLDHP